MSGLAQGRCPPLCHNMPVKFLFFCAFHSVLHTMGSIYPKVNPVPPFYFIFVASVPPFTPHLTTMWFPPTLSLQDKGTGELRAQGATDSRHHAPGCPLEGTTGEREGRLQSMRPGRSKALGGKDRRGNVRSSPCQPAHVAWTHFGLPDPVAALLSRPPVCSGSITESGGTASRAWLRGFVAVRTWADSLTTLSLSNGESSPGGSIRTALGVQ